MLINKFLMKPVLKVELFVIFLVYLFYLINYKFSMLIKESSASFLQELQFVFDSLFL